MASQQLQMVFQPLPAARITKTATAEIGRALSDGQVQSFDVGSIQRPVRQQT